MRGLWSSGADPENTPRSSQEAIRAPALRPSDLSGLAERFQSPHRARAAGRWHVLHGGSGELDKAGLGFPIYTLVILFWLVFWLVTPRGTALRSVGDYSLVLIVVVVRGQTQFVDRWLACRDAEVTD